MQARKMDANKKLNASVGASVSVHASAKANGVNASVNASASLVLVARSLVASRRSNELVAGSW